MSSGNPDYISGKTGTHNALGKVRGVGYVQEVCYASASLAASSTGTITITGKGGLLFAYFLFSGGGISASDLTVSFNPDSQGALVNFAALEPLASLAAADYNLFRVASSLEFSLNFLQPFNANLVVSVANADGVNAATCTIFLIYACESGGTVTYAVFAGGSKSGSNSGAGFSVTKLEF